MDDIRQYILQIVAAALICGIAAALPFSKGMLHSVVKFVTGMLLVLSVIQPWITISLDELLDWKGDISLDGTNFASEGAKKANEMYRQSITEQTEAYILDEAEALDCTLKVVVTLSDGELPVPERVTLTGNVSPYAKQALSAILENQLGIKQEAQTWIN